MNSYRKEAWPTTESNLYTCRDSWAYGQHSNNETEHELEPHFGGRIDHSACKPCSKNKAATEGLLAPAGWSENTHRATAAPSSLTSGQFPLQRTDLFVAIKPLVRVNAQKEGPFGAVASAKTFHIKVLPICEVGTKGS